MRAHGKSPSPLENVARAHRSPDRMNRRKADFKFVYKYLEDEL